MAAYTGTGGNGRLVPPFSGINSICEGAAAPRLQSRAEAYIPGTHTVATSSANRIAKLTTCTNSCFPPGEAVEVNNLGPHWVRNDGDTDRVHLIFEYYDADQPDPSWLEPFLLSGAAR